MVWAAALWGWFTTEMLARAIMAGFGAERTITESLVWHPARITLYAVWLVSLLWFAWLTLRMPAPAESSDGPGGGDPTGRLEDA